MKLQYYSNSFVELLRKEASSNASKYGSQSWLEGFAGEKPFLFDSDQVVDSPPQLVVSADDNAANDAENAKRIHRWLKNLPPVVAMEERLWANLTHSVFAQYMQSRWPVDNDNTIHRRYLFEGKSFAALSRNGIARLWWAGHLTFDPKRQNEYELTDTLFYRQDIQVSLLERRIGKCRTIRMAVLEFLEKNKDWLSSKAFGRRIQLLLKEINLLGGVAILDALPHTEIMAFLTSVGESLVAEENGAAQ